MDLHSFHPVFFATPHGRYAIPQHVGNFGFAERTGIEARPAPWRCQDEAGRLIPAKCITPGMAKKLRCHPEVAKMKPAPTRDQP